LYPLIFLPIPYLLSGYIFAYRNLLSGYRKTLKKGNAKSLINQMDELIAVATGERCKIMVGKRNYLLDAYREGRLNYDKAITQKLPIGSGAL